MGEYLPYFFWYMGISMTVTLIAHFTVDGVDFNESQSEFGEEEFSVGMWIFGSALLPIMALFVFIPGFFEDRRNRREDEKNKREDEKNERERKRRNEEFKKKEPGRKKRLEKEREEERAEVLKKPSVTFKRFKKGDTTVSDYNNLIAICENLPNLDKGNSDEVVEIVREAILAISDKNWSSTNKSKCEEKLMKALEKLSNG